MPTHHHPEHRVHEDRGEYKKRPGRGAKEKEIAATLTAAAVALAGGAVMFPSLDAASDAVAGIYSRMFELVAAGPPDQP